MKARVLQMEAAPSIPAQQLVDRYDPQKIADFVGFESIRALLTKFAKQPYKAWLFVGPSGVGKTSLALILAELLDGELYHVASRECTQERVEAIIKRTAYHPSLGKKWHVIVVDEADQMTKAAQHAFLSVLDRTHQPEGTIFIFTANETYLLEDRFQSRCRPLHFNLEDLTPAVGAYLARIWKKEHGWSPAPDFGEVFRRSKNNVRTALMNLELLLLDRRYQIPEPKAATATAPKLRGEVDPARRAAALKAWDTIRRNKAAGR
jgi:DNA polymerase III gamma/tau subunit